VEEGGLPSMIKWTNTTVARNYARISGGALEVGIDPEFPRRGAAGDFNIVGLEFVDNVPDTVHCSGTVMLPYCAGCEAKTCSQCPVNGSCATSQSTFSASCFSSVNAMCSGHSIQCSWKTSQATATCQCQLGWKGENCDEEVTGGSMWWVWVTIGVVTLCVIAIGLLVLKKLRRKVELEPYKQVPRTDEDGHDSE